MKKVKTIQQFAEENPDKVHTVDSEKLEKANENIKNAIKEKKQRKRKQMEAKWGTDGSIKRMAKKSSIW